MIFAELHSVLLHASPQHALQLADSDQSITCFHSFKLIFSPGYETEPQTINVVDLKDETRLVVSGLAAVLLDALYELGQ